MRHRIIALSDISAHPVGSLSPSDYIFEQGQVVKRRDDGARLVVRSQQAHLLEVALVEHVPGPRGSAFACTLLPPVTIYEVTPLR